MKLTNMSTYTRYSENGERKGIGDRLQCLCIPYEWENAKKLFDEVVEKYKDDDYWTFVLWSNQDSDKIELHGIRDPDPVDKEKEKQKEIQEAIRWINWKADLHGLNVTINSK